VIIPTNFNTATQLSVPPWVKGRAISFYLTVLFGSFAVGAVIWGKVTTAHGIHVTLLAGGISMLALLTLAIWFPLTLNAGKDLAPAYSGKPGDDVLGARPEASGLVRVTIRYKVPTHRARGFTDLLNDLKLTRLRNGAKRWQLERQEGSDDQTLFAELVTFGSWDEYTRFHSRTTKWDVMLEGLAREYHAGSEPPAIVADELRSAFGVLPPRAKATPIDESKEGPAVASSAVTSAQPNPTAAGHWLEDRIIDVLDRTLDEMFVMYDRISTRSGQQRRLK
jgi:hypothetical protein